MVLALDIGGTNIRIALVEGRKIKSFKSFRITGEYNRDLANIAIRVKELTEADWSKSGIAIAGAYDQLSGILTNSVNLSSWTGKNIRQDFTQILGVEPSIANDAYCAALAVAQYDSPRGDFWYVNWGTGIGGCLGVDIGAGFKIRPSEIGHMSLEKSGVACRCGQFGCWDALAGGGAVLRKFHKEYIELPSSEKKELVRIFSVGLVNLYVALPVSEIILNGGIILGQKDILAEISGNFNEYLKILGSRPRIRISKTAHFAGLMGAELLHK